MWILNIENSLIELGAQFIHGNKKNPLFDLMNSLNEVDNKTICIYLKYIFNFKNSILLLLFKQ